MVTRLDPQTHIGNLNLRVRLDNQVRREGAGTFGARAALRASKADRTTAFASRPETGGR